GESEARGLLQRDALELLHEVEVPVIAAELAVGDRLQTNRLLLCHRCADCLVLNLSQIRTFRFAGLGKLGRPQQASHMIGVEGRFHGRILCREVIMDFPNETAAYRAARNKLLESELALRTQIEK